MNTRIETLIPYFHNFLSIHILPNPIFSFHSQTCRHTQKSFNNMHSKAEKLDINNHPMHAQSSCIHKNLNPNTTYNDSFYPTQHYPFTQKHACMPGNHQKTCNQKQTNSKPIKCIPCKYADAHASGGSWQLQACAKGRQVHVV